MAKKNLLLQFVMGQNNILTGLLYRPSHRLRILLACYRLTVVRKERGKECERNKSRERTNDILITPSDRVTSQLRNIIDWAQGLLVSENIPGEL